MIEKKIRKILKYGFWLALAYGLIWLTQPGFRYETDFFPTNIQQLDEIVRVDFYGTTERTGPFFLQHEKYGSPYRFFLVIRQKPGREIKSIDRLYMQSKGEHQSIDLYQKKWLFEKGSLRQKAEWINSSIHINEFNIETGDYFLHLEYTSCQELDCQPIQKTIHIGHTKTKKFVSLWFLHLMGI